MCPVLLVIAGILMLVGPVFAQVAVIEADPEPAPKPIDVELGYGYQANTDLKKSSGDFHRNDFRARLNAEISFSDTFKLDNILVYSNNNYSFSASSPFQWDSINRFMYAPLFKWQTSQQWTLMAAPVVQWMGESGAKASKSFTGGGLVGFNYVASPTLSVGLLIGALSQIEDKAIVAPIPVIHWKFAESWALRTGVLSLGPTPGVGGEVGWKVAKSVELAGGLQFQRRRFRLDKNDAVGQERMVPVYGKITWWMAPQAAIEVFGSVTTNGNLRLENKNGHKITDKDYDNTAYFGGKLHFIF
jgi:hypothetical protein